MNIMLLTECCLKMLTQSVHTIALFPVSIRNKSLTFWTVNPICICNCICSCMFVEEEEEEEEEIIFRTKTKHKDE